MSLKAELKQIFYDLEIFKEPGRDEIAHFCYHQGIRLWFSRTRTTWHSIGPSAIKPWWMILEPLRTLSDTEDDLANNNNNKAIEVTENA
ncbi:MAG: hypothetical protein JSW45_05360 [Thiotrichales bacterium]|nr:MAG: hypothetical protein JSW45_05360 [Thiotrichales bacterium]